jgi:hypothetical protein
VKTGCNLAEFSKEGYGSKRAIFPMIMIVMMIKTLKPIFWTYVVRNNLV